MSNLLSRVKADHAANLLRATLSGKYEPAQITVAGTVVATNLIAVGGQQYRSEGITATPGSAVSVRNIGTPAKAIFGPATGGGIASTASGHGSTTVVGADHGAVTLATPSALLFADQPTQAGLSIADSLAGDGLTITGKIMAVGAGNGITVNADDVALTTPGGLSATSTNSATGNHTHAIDSSSDPGAAAAILASSAAGALTVQSMTVKGTRAAPSVLQLRSTTNDDNWSANDPIGAVEFYSTDASSLGAGVKASIRAFQPIVGAAGGFAGLSFHTTNTTGANDAERMRIDQTGKVGIGTTSLGAYLLSVAGTAKFTGSVDVDAQFLGQAADTSSAPSFSWTTDTNAGMYRPAADTVAFTTAGSERMRIDPTGNVGIGTTPAYKLDVGGDMRTTGDLFVDGGRVDFGANYFDEVTDFELRGTKSLSLFQSIKAASWNMTTAGALTAVSGDLSSALTVGGALTVGANVLYVNTAGTRVGINRAPDSQFDLDVAGAIRGQYLVGKHALQLDNAAALIHFDGPAPYSLDFTGTSTSHMGNVATESGGVIYRPGLYNKAAQLAEATTNLFTNPTFDSTTTGFTYYSAGVATINADGVALYGQTCLSFTPGASANPYMYQVYAGAMTTAQTYTFSAYIKAGNEQAIGKAVTLNLRENGDGAYLNSQAYTITNEWTRVTLSRTLTHATPADLAYWLVFNTTASSGDILLVDGVQMERKDYATPYCDGSLGAGHTWTGAPHASTSSRTAGSINFGNIVNRSQYTVAGWFKIASAENQTIATAWRPVFFQVGTYNTNPSMRIGTYSTNPYLSMFSRNTTATGWTIAGDSAGNLNYLAGEWVFIAVTYDGTKHTVYAQRAEQDALVTTVMADTPAHYGYGDRLRLAIDAALGLDLVDEVIVLDVAADAKLIASIYHSNAPVFAESSVVSFRSPSKATIEINEFGLWGRGVAGGAIIGIYGGNPRWKVGDPPDTRSWGGVELQENDLLIGRTSTGTAIHWDDSAGEMILGVQAQAHVSLTSGHVALKYGATALADLQATSLTLGNAAEENLFLTASVLQFRNATQTQGSLSGTTWILGRDDGANNNVHITPTALSLRSGTTKLAELAGSTLTLGSLSTNYVLVTASSIEIGRNSVAKISLDASGNASFAGAIDANSGTIGALEIDGALTVGTGGRIASGATAWATGTGFWFEYNGGNPRVRIGTAAANRLTFETSTGILTIAGSGAGITAISGSNITTGTIDASVVAVTNLSASNITTGTLSADRIATGSLDAGKITALTITAAQIAANTITAAQIAANTITASQLSFVPVTSTNVVASINATAEGVRIAGNRITVDGDVTFSAGYNPTSKITTGGAAADVNANTTTISGGKITASSITAAQITALTITAAQIAANTITAAKIAANTITASQLSFVPVTSTNVVASINATAEGVRIAGNRITVDGDVTFSAGYNPTSKITTGGAAADVNANTTTISGGKITANSITGDRISLQSYLAIGATADAGAWGTDGIQLQYNAGNPRAYIGNGASGASGRYFQFDGANISWQGTNTSLSAAGVLSATGAVLSGTLSAASGNVLLDDTGVSIGIPATWADVNAYRFSSGDTTVSGFWGYESASGVWASIHVNHSPVTAPAVRAAKFANLEVASFSMAGYVAYDTLAAYCLDAAGTVVKQSRVLLTAQQFGSSINLDADIAEISGNTIWHAGNLTPGNYSLTSHLHTGVYAPVSHTHTGVYAPVSHTHAYGDITGNGSIYTTGTVNAKVDTAASVHALGFARIGHPTASNAMFAHKDNFSNDEYALAQDSGGVTYLNAAAGQHITIRNDDTEIARFKTGFQYLNGYLKLQEIATAPGEADLTGGATQGAIFIKNDKLYIGFRRADNAVRYWSLDLTDTTSSGTAVPWMAAGSSV